MSLVLGVATLSCVVASALSPFAIHDYKNRLVGVTEKATGTPIATYVYYSDNRRAQKTVFASGETTTFFYDGWQVCEETGASNATYVWNPVYVDELCRMDRDGGQFYAHQNARADVVAVSDATGAVVEQGFFDDYGQVFDTAKQGTTLSAVGNPYGFQGRRLDPETGLYYFRNRYYSPSEGRFIQRDPVWDAGNVGGQYSFAGSGPLSGRDPLGSLQRRQVDWLAAKWIPNWPGIGAKRIGIPEVGETVAKIKERLGKERGSDLSGKASEWTRRNDVELQEMLDKGLACLEGFPGKAYDPQGLEELHDAIGEAFLKYARLAGESPRTDLGIDPETMLAWVMKESSGDASGSPYGEQSGKSTATGLLQMTKTSYNDMLDRNRVPNVEAAKAEFGMPARWSDEAMSDPVKGILAGLLLLKDKMAGGDLKRGLENYLGSPNSQANQKYAQTILEGGQLAKDRLGTLNDFHKLSAVEQRQFMSDLDKKVHK